jgi:hypothetical protein
LNFAAEDMVDADTDALDPQTIIAVGEGRDAWIPRRSPRSEPRLAPLDPDRLQTARRSILSTVRDEIVRFKIRLASTEGSRSSASYLIQKMYGWRGYAVSPLSADKRPITIVASDGAQALATISIGFDSREKLLADELYGPELGSLRLAGARLCEFTRLAVDRNEQSREVLAMMFHIAYMYARRFANCTDLLIEVNPRHVRFYRAMLGFEVLGEERTCPRVNAPAVLLRLDLSYAQRQIARFGGHRELAAKVRSLYPLAFSPKEEDGICGRLRELG